MDTNQVTYRVENGVAWLTINRPEARNALNKAVRDGLFAGVRRFNDDAEAKVLVLTGAGEKAFCAGGDLKRRPSGWAPTCPWPRRTRRPRRSEPVYLSADAQEGPAAFRDERPPVWTGR